MGKLCREVFGLAPMIEEDGWTMFPMPNGTMLDLFEPDSEMIPAYGFNDGIAFGFRVDDIEATSAELQAAGVEFPRPRSEQHRTGSRPVDAEVGPTACTAALPRLDEEPGA